MLGPVAKTVSAFVSYGTIDELDDAIAWDTTRAMALAAGRSHKDAENLAYDARDAELRDQTIPSFSRRERYPVFKLTIAYELGALHGDVRPGDYFLGAFGAADACGYADDHACRSVFTHAYLDALQAVYPRGVPVDASHYIVGKL